MWRAGVGRAAAVGGGGGGSRRACYWGAARAGWQAVGPRHPMLGLWVQRLSAVAGQPPRQEPEEEEDAQKREERAERRARRKLLRASAEVAHGFRDPLPTTRAEKRARRVMKVFRRRFNSPMAHERERARQALGIYMEQVLLPVIAGSDAIKAMRGEDNADGEDFHVMMMTMGGIDGDGDGAGADGKGDSTRPALGTERTLREALECNVPGVRPDEMEDYVMLFHALTESPPELRDLMMREIQVSTQHSRALDEPLARMAEAGELGAAELEELVKLHDIDVRRQPNPFTPLANTPGLVRGVQSMLRSFRAFFSRNEPDGPEDADHAKRQAAAARAAASHKKANSWWAAATGGAASSPEAAAAAQAAADAVAEHGTRLTTRDRSIAEQRAANIDPRESPRFSAHTDTRLDQRELDLNRATEQISRTRQAAAASRGQARGKVGGETDEAEQPHLPGGNTGVVDDEREQAERARLLDEDALEDQRLADIGSRMEEHGDDVGVHDVLRATLDSEHDDLDFGTPPDKAKTAK